jgi:hypothetical protein
LLLPERPSESESDSDDGSSIEGCVGTCAPAADPEAPGPDAADPPAVEAAAAAVVTGGDVFGSLIADAAPRA